MHSGLNSINGEVVYEETERGSLNKSRIVWLSITELKLESDKLAN